MLVGYMRVSTAEQNVALQRDALLAAVLVNLTTLSSGLWCWLAIPDLQNSTADLTLSAVHS